MGWHTLHCVWKLGSFPKRWKGGWTGANDSDNTKRKLCGGKEMKKGHTGQFGAREDMIGSRLISD